MKNATANNTGSKSGAGTVTQHLLREGLLIVYAVLACFLLIALISYSPDDPGFNTTHSGREVSNAVGFSGAWIASVLLHMLGYLAYALPISLCYLIYAQYRETDVEDNNRPQENVWALIALKSSGFLLLLLSACGLAALHFERSAQTAAEISGWPAGGWIGALLLAPFQSLLATLGSTLFFLACFLFGLTVIMNISWLHVVDTLGGWILGGVSWIRLYILKWQEVYRQRQEARQRVEDRKKVLDVHLKKTRKRVAPTIADPVIKPPIKSQRVEKEKQGALFVTNSVTELPAINLLDAWQESNESGFSKDSLEAMSRLLELKLKDFGIDIEVTAVNPGPVITRFEVQPAPGVKVNRISNLVKDLARSLAVISVRVVEVIPGKTVIGIEIPNEQREIIQLSQVLSSTEFDRAGSSLSMALGHDIVGRPVIVDLERMPHLLVAGTTGSGKSVGINAMVLSLLFKSTPEEVRMIMIDPKMLELSVYDGIPHLLTPVITDMKDAANGLRWCVAEMERRYRLMSALSVRNLAGFNRKVVEAQEAGTPLLDPTWQADPALAEGEQMAPELDALPSVVVIVDELADMMMVVGKKVEELIARIAQKARAAGIHLILATQRPSVDVLTGLIKANIPTRLSFMVQSKIDSRTILGEGGAEQLLGHGDMLFLPPGEGLPTRVHGAFVSDEEVHRVVADWKERGTPVYIESITQESSEGQDLGNFTMPDSDGDGDGEDDALYNEAVRFVVESRKASISSVQRKLRIGYNRAARMIESMEMAGVVSEMSSNGTREVIAPPP
ncbi:MAG: DNA translocase FtsK [Pseudohongiellaceae bacterium]